MHRGFFVPEITKQPKSKLSKHNMIQRVFVEYDKHSMV